MRSQAKHVGFDLPDTAISKSPGGRLTDAKNLAQFAIVDPRPRDQSLELNLLK